MSAGSVSVGFAVVGASGAVWGLLRSASRDAGQYLTWQLPAGLLSCSRQLLKWPRPMLPTRTAFLAAALLLGAVTAFAQESGTGPFLIYFDEFSANLTQQTRPIIADVAQRARDAKAVRIEARAS